MKPILYYDDRSPPVRSVLMLINILDIEVDLKYVDLFKGDQLKPEFKELNPAHTVPVLVDNDLILTDSHVILIHLCEKYQGDNFQLWPTEYNERMQVLNLLLFECSIIFRRDSDMMSEIVRKTFAHIDLAYHQRKIHEIFGMAETYLSKHKFIACDKVTDDDTKFMTIADLSAVTTLSTIDLMFPIAEIPQPLPLLKKWLQHMSLMPEYQINRKGLVALRTVVEEYGKFRFPKRAGEEGKVGI